MSGGVPTPDEVAVQVDEYLKSLMSLLREVSRISPLSPEIQSKITGAAYVSMWRFESKDTGGELTTFLRHAGRHGLLPSRYGKPREALLDLKDHPERIERTGHLLALNSGTPKLLEAAARKRATQVSMALATYVRLHRVSYATISRRTGLSEVTVARVLGKPEGNSRLRAQLTIGVALGLEPERVFMLPDVLPRLEAIDRALDLELAPRLDAAPRPKRTHKPEIVHRPEIARDAAARPPKRVIYLEPEPVVEPPSPLVVQAAKERDARRAAARLTAREFTRLPKPIIDRTPGEIDKAVVAYLEKLTMLAGNVRIKSLLSKSQRMHLFGAAYSNVRKYEGQKLGGSSSTFYRYVGMLGVLPSRQKSLRETLLDLHKNPDRVRRTADLLSLIPNVGDRLQAAGVERTRQVCAALVKYAELHDVSYLELAKLIESTADAVRKSLVRGVDDGGGLLYMHLSVGMAMGLEPDEVFALPEKLREMEPVIVREALAAQQHSSSHPGRDEVEKKVSTYLGALSDVIEALDIPSRVPLGVRRHFLGAASSVAENGLANRQPTHTILGYAALAGLLPSRYPVLLDSLMDLRDEPDRSNRTLELLVKLPNARSSLELAASRRSAQIDASLTMYARWMGVSQVQLAEISGIPQTMISGVFNRSTGATHLSTQLKIGVALGLEPDQVLQLPELMQKPARRVRERTSWSDVQGKSWRDVKAASPALRRRVGATRCRNVVRPSAGVAPRERDDIDENLDEFVGNVRTARESADLSFRRIAALFGPRYHFTQSLGDPSFRTSKTLLRLASAVGVAPHQFRDASRELRRLANDPEEVDRRTAHLASLSGIPSELMAQAAASWSHEMSDALGKFIAESGITFAHVDRLNHMGVQSIWDVISKNAEGSRTLDSLLRIGSALGVEPDDVFGLPDHMRDPIKVPYVPRHGRFEAPMDATASRIAHLARLSTVSSSARVLIEDVVRSSSAAPLSGVSLAKDDVYPVSDDELQKLCAGALLALPENGHSLDKSVSEAAIEMWGGRPAKLGPTLDWHDYSLVS